MVIIYWFDNKLVFVMSMTFNPIDFDISTCVIQWHANDLIEVDSYIMYKAQMAHLGKHSSSMNHLKFSAFVTRVIIKQGIVLMSKKMVMVKDCFPCPFSLHYNM